MACIQHNIFLILHVYLYACARKINDVEALMQSTRVSTRCVHDNLYEHECVSGTYTPNPVRMYSRTSIIWISIILTLGYPNAILNFEIPKDALIFCKTK